MRQNALCDSRIEVLKGDFVGSFFLLYRAQNVVEKIV